MVKLETNIIYMGKLEKIKPDIMIIMIIEEYCEK